MDSSMTPVDWAKRPLLKYADFTGRAPRAEYWWFFLAVFVAEIVAMVIDSILGTGRVIASYGWVWTLVMLACVVPNLAVSARRLHDTGRSGWWILIAFIPIIGVILLIVWFATAGAPEENRFGPNPYGIGASAAPVAAE